MVVIVHVAEEAVEFATHSNEVNVTEETRADSAMTRQAAVEEEEEQMEDTLDHSVLPVYAMHSNVVNASVEIPADSVMMQVAELVDQAEVVATVEVELVELAMLSNVENAIVEILADSLTKLPPLKCCFGSGMWLWDRYNFVSCEIKSSRETMMRWK